MRRCTFDVIVPFVVGREQAAGVRYRKLGTEHAQTVEGTPSLVRYADSCRAPDYADAAVNVLVRALTGLDRSA